VDRQRDLELGAFRGKVTMDSDIRTTVKNAEGDQSFQEGVKIIAKDG